MNEFKVAVAEINLSSLKNNFKVVKFFAPDAKIVAMVKSDAYGHGYSRVVETLANVGADAFGVARLSEAILLRKSGINKKIILMEGFFDPAELILIGKYELIVILHSQYQINEILNKKLSKPLNVWLKIDTGMHRVGIQPESFEKIYNSLINCINIKQVPIIISHFACADKKNHPLTKKQLALFNKLTKKYKNEKSLANSAAIITLPEAINEWVRPGIMLYGVSPIEELTILELNLQPVMTLKTIVISVNVITKGESIGYGATYTLPHTTKIAIIALGYGDGYPRNAPAGTPILLNGKTYSIVGRVSMDMISIDIGNDEVHIGDEVILWGAGLPIETVAKHVGTIPYELLCGLTNRVKRIYFE